MRSLMLREVGDPAQHHTAWKQGFETRRGVSAHTPSTWGCLRSDHSGHFCLPFWPLAWESGLELVSISVSSWMYIPQAGRWKVPGRLLKSYCFHSSVLLPACPQRQAGQGRRMTKQMLSSWATLNKSLHFSELHPQRETDHGNAADTY